MRFTKTSLIPIACALLFAGAALAQQTAQQTIGTLEPTVKAGTANHAQQLSKNRVARHADSDTGLTGSDDVGNRDFFRENEGERTGPESFCDAFGRIIDFGQFRQLSQ